MNILNVKKLTKKYDDTTVVDNISFQIEQGEIFGIVAPMELAKAPPST